MSSILDAFPYPYHEPLARELHVKLSDLLINPQIAQFYAAAAKIDATMIYFYDPPFLVAKSMLDQAAKDGAVRKLVQSVIDRLSQTSPVRGFFEAVLAEQPMRISAEPRGENGEAKFISKDDNVTEPEALLYRDDLTLQIGRVPALIGILGKLLTLAPAVCKLNVDLPGASKVGTGFRIGPDMLLTNWHVLHGEGDGKRATAVTAEFGYEDGPDGALLPGKAIKCDPATIHTDHADDWAVIRVSEPMANEWPIVSLNDSAAPVEGSATYIIQHPAGARKRLGFVRNQIAFFDARVVHYLTDTQSGSSGSPVFDANGQLVALHHAGGRPQEVVGRPPLRKNEGILISRIIEGLKQAGIDPAVVPLAL
jgi:S1-C subfamily serine protease